MAVRKKVRSLAHRFRHLKAKKFHKPIGVTVIFNSQDTGFITDSRDENNPNRLQITFLFKDFHAIIIFLVDVLAQIFTQAQRTVTNPTYEEKEMD